MDENGNAYSIQSYTASLRVLKILDFGTILAKSLVFLSAVTDKIYYRISYLFSPCKALYRSVSHW